MCSHASRRLEIDLTLPYARPPFQTVGIIYPHSCMLIFCHTIDLIIFITIPKNCALRTLYKKQVIIYIYLPTSKCLAFSYFQEFLLFTLNVCLWGFCLLCRHTKMTLEIREEKSCSLPKTKCFEDTRRIDKETYSSLNIMSTDSHIKPT